MDGARQFAPHVPKRDLVHPLQDRPNPALIRNRLTQPGELFLTERHGDRLSVYTPGPLVAWSPFPRLIALHHASQGYPSGLAHLLLELSVGRG